MKGTEAGVRRGQWRQRFLEASEREKERGQKMGDQRRAGRVEHGDDEKRMDMEKRGRERKRESDLLERARRRYKRGARASDEAVLAEDALHPVKSNSQSQVWVKRRESGGSPLLLVGGVRELALELAVDTRRGRAVSEAQRRRTCKTHAFSSRSALRSAFVIWMSRFMATWASAFGSVASAYICSSSSLKAS